LAFRAADAGQNITPIFIGFWTADAEQTLDTSGPISAGASTWLTQDAARHWLSTFKFVVSPCRNSRTELSFAVVDQLDRLTPTSKRS
jgi:hypothetical protein